MNAARNSGPPDAGGKRGGLPDDDLDLDAFAAAANAASPTTATSAPARHLAVAAPQPSVPGPDARVRDLEPAAGPANPPSLTDAVSSPELITDEASETGQAPGTLPEVPYGSLVRQATVSVAADIADRFRNYKRREAQHGPVPSSADVIFRALRAGRGRYSDVVASHMPQADPDWAFGGPAPGRRRSTEARLASQINFRPLVSEMAAIKDLAEQAGAPSVSFFVDALLDDFLPRSPGRPRRN